MPRTTAANSPDLPPQPTGDSDRFVACDVRVFDPRTGQPWPPKLNTVETSRYLKVRHGIPESPQTLCRKRSEGVGITWRYAGQTPLATREEIDRYAAQEALTDISPLRRKPPPAAPSSARPQKRRG